MQFTLQALWLFRFGIALHWSSDEIANSRYGFICGSSPTVGAAFDKTEIFKKGSILLWSGEVDNTEDAMGKPHQWFTQSSMSIGSDHSLIIADEFTRATRVAKATLTAPAADGSGDANGLMIVHDDLEVDWSTLPLPPQTNSFGSEYGETPVRFYEQLYMFDKPATLDLGESTISARACDLIHLFFFVRQDGDPERRIHTAAEWSFRPLHAAHEDFYVRYDTEAKEVLIETTRTRLEEKGFRLPSDLSGKDFIKFAAYYSVNESDNESLSDNPSALGPSDSESEFVTLYSYKPDVYCTERPSDLSAKPVLRKIADAQLQARLDTDLTEEEGEGLNRDVMNFDHDDEPFTYHMHDVPATNHARAGVRLPVRGAERHEFVSLELSWTNLPPVADCPVVVWDPMLRLPPTSGALIANGASASGVFVGLAGMYVLVCLL